MIRIAVVSDNIFLVRKFKDIVLTIPDVVAKYYYSAMNRNANELIKAGCNPIDLKENWEVLKPYSVIFSLHCKQIFPRELVASHRCYNLHPGFNPFNRGWFPQVFSIINKLPAGATLHEMDEKIDNGGIVDQIQVHVETYDTSLTIYNRVLEAEVEILKRNLKKVIDSNYMVTTPGQGNYNSIRDYKDLLELDLEKRMKVGDVINLLRALTHPPYKNAYFIDPLTKAKYLVQIEIEKAKDN